MDKSMTGDGAVVRDALTPEQTARWMEATAKCMKHPGDAIPVAALQAGARYIRQQAAEIERLTAHCRVMEGQVTEAFREMRVEYNRTEASEARTADLLKALGAADRLVDWLRINRERRELPADFEEVAAMVAAAKGETV